jgi:hypothetical protein
MTFRSELPVGRKTTAHLNLKFSIADMDRIESMARRKMSLENMAWELAASGLHVEQAELARLLRNNGFTYFGLAGWGE